MEDRTSECLCCKSHDWELIAEENFGEMDYSSYGGGVEPFNVQTWRCRNCGALRKECTGDFNGDPSALLACTEEERAAARRSLMKERTNAVSSGTEEKPRHMKRKGFLIALIVIALLSLFVCLAF